MRRAVLAAGCIVAVALAPRLWPGPEPQARAATATSTSVATATPTPTATAVGAAHVPVLAYYYIWYDASSWRRAKTDYPVVGRYSSDDAKVVREQVRLAKRAGINGFIVSWKHTPVLDRRLAQLVDIAEQEHFRLAIIYQGLDFHRRPLPVDTVARDLQYFAVAFAKRAPFQIFAKPLVIWSGTWQFSADDVARATAPVRGSIAVLGSEKNVAGYDRISSSVDGDAYYWSSVNPKTFQGYIEKLSDLGEAVRRAGGIWIAPAAVGFDARKVGGSTIVGRAGGSTLLTEIDAAITSSPDAIGLISWNEYSENSHIEPSVRYGYRALDVVGERLGSGAVSTTLPAVPKVDHRAIGAHRRPTSGSPSGPNGPVVLAVFGALGATLVVVGVRRARRTPHLRVVGLDVAAREDAQPSIGSLTRSQIMAARRRARRIHLDRERPT